MPNEKYGFVYIWFDKKYKRYYIGSHWGYENDGYICSSRMMRQSYNRRPFDFKRRVIQRVYTNREELLLVEKKWLSLIDPEKTMPKNSTKESRQNVRYYNMKLGTQNQWWSKDEERLTVGQKISKAKKGKPIGPCSPEKAKLISEAKKASFEKRRQESGYAVSPEVAKKLGNNNLGNKHTEEWKQQASERLKKQWETGVRKKSTPKQTMTKEDQAKITSNKLKQLWADPVWAETQRKKLTEARKRRA